MKINSSLIEREFYMDPVLPLPVAGKTGHSVITNDLYLVVSVNVR